MKRVIQRSWLLAVFVPFLCQGQGSGPITLSLPQPEKEVFACSPGPWGDLEYYYTYLEAPDHTMELVNMPSEKTTWSVPGMTVEEIRAWMTGAGVAPEMQKAILDVSLPFHPSPPYRLYPPNEVVEALSPETRTILYGELRRWSENRYYFSPAIIESRNVREWFSSSSLSPESISHIEKLTYKIGNSLAFSDVSAVLTKITSDTEERAFLRALTRTRSLILKLRITPDSDFDALKKYWTMGYKSKDVLPFFEALARTGGVDKIDVVHLLPPTPRKYLYTFPSFSLGIEGSFPDSFWTALNFACYRPLDDFNIPEYVQAYSRDNFIVTGPPYQFGDIVVAIDPQSGLARQACVYIAENIVYTKNGRSVLRPFMLMKLDDLMARFASETPPQIAVWRTKPR